MKIWVVLHQVFRGDLHVDAFRDGMGSAGQCVEEILDGYERDGSPLTQDATNPKHWYGEDGETYIELCFSERGNQYTSIAIYRHRKQAEDFCQGEVGPQRLRIVPPPTVVDCSPNLSTRDRQSRGEIT